MSIHIVLVHPKIPANTGNIIRLCANTGAVLHLVEPIAFELDDSRLKRAGLDYHEYAYINIHQDWQACHEALLALGVCEMLAMTTKFSLPFFDYKTNTTCPIALVFGSETDGLPQAVREQIGSNHWLRLPMLPNSRSLNLSNSVAICLYEVWRQRGFDGDIGGGVGYHRLSSRP